MKKILMISTIAVLLITLVYQGSMAFFVAEQSVATPISAGKLGMKLVDYSEEKNAVMSKKGYQFEKAMPGAVLSRQVHVENVEQKTLYLRVSATKYWTDKDGNKLPDKDASLIKLTTKDPTNWIIRDDAANSNSEIVYFYYRYPLKANDKTTNIMDAIEISSQLTNQEYAEHQVKVLIEANAVQEYAAKEAIENEWGMDATFDKNGVLLDIKE
ncbi:MAG: hypothetical protein RR252_05835 [Longicatena sp.]